MEESSLKDKPVKFIETDVGLGDAICTAGLLTYLAEKYKIIMRISQAQMKNKITLLSFFDGIPIQIVDYGWEDPNKINPAPIFQDGRLCDPVIRTRIPDPFYRLFSYCVRNHSEEPIYPYPEGFYKYFHLNYSIRKQYCPLRMNSYKVKQLPLPKKPFRYIFVFDDKERNFIIPPKRVESWKVWHIAKPVYNPNVSVLAYRDIIENAREIHCIDSSFFHLVNSFKPKGKLFYHWYARPNSPEFDMHPEWVKLR